MTHRRETHHGARESRVVVQRRDLASTREEALRFLAAQGDERYERIVSLRTETWGTVETTNGLYALCEEGVGPSDPITDLNPLVVEFWPGYARKPDGSSSFGMTPIAEAKLTDEQLRELPAEDVPLVDFIRVFGARLESNFAMWKAKLDPIYVGS